MSCWFTVYVLAEWLIFVFSALCSCVLVYLILKPDGWATKPVSTSVSSASASFANSLFHPLPLRPAPLTPLQSTNSMRSHRWAKTFAQLPNDIVEALRLWSGLLAGATAERGVRGSGRAGDSSFQQVPGLKGSQIFGLRWHRMARQQSIKT